MTGSRLFKAQLHLVRARIDVREALGLLLPVLPSRAVEVEAVKKVLGDTERASGLLKRAILTDEKRGRVIPFPRDGR